MPPPEDNNNHDVDEVVDEGEPEDLVQQQDENDSNRAGDDHLQTPTEDEECINENVIDNDNEPEEEVQGQIIEDACHDMHNNDVDSESVTDIQGEEDIANTTGFDQHDISTTVTTRSGRNTTKHDYKSFGTKGTTQFSQVSRGALRSIVRQQNPKRPMKR